MLTGKCLTDFEKWLEKEHGQTLVPIIYTDITFKFTPSDYFEDLPLSFQYGVMVDFFDGVGVYIQLVLDSNYYDVDINGQWVEGGCETRPEARTAAIDKACQIYNSK